MTIENSDWKFIELDLSGISNGTLMNVSSGTTGIGSDTPLLIDCYYFI